jgi:pimeloyl-ACP methyl ester carboxylesterase
MQQSDAHAAAAYAVTLLVVPARAVRIVACVAVAAAVAAMLDPLATASATTTARETTSSIEWRACGDSFRCGTLAVPLDYGNPAGGTIDLAVVERQARDPQARIGSLVVNPGGPGAPGVDYLKSVADSLPGELRDRFDLVGFDPRGVGESSPIECRTNIDPLFDARFSPVTAADRAGLVAAFRALVDACSRDNAALLPHVSTVDGARDLDRLRAALGDRRLTYVGQSYGTYLGTMYATLFPDRVRALVLDGAIDPADDGAAVVLSQARGFTRALDEFLIDCSQRRSCAFHHHGRTGPAYDALRARAARSPLAALRSGGRTLNETRFDAAVAEALYAGRAGWVGLAQALSDADHGNAATLLGYADNFTGREAGGGGHQALDAFWAISCLDGPIVGNLDAAARLEARARDVAPRFGAFLVNFSLACSMWPVPPVTVPGRLDAAGAPPLLVIGTTDDPVTPLVAAQSLARELQHGVLLVAKGVQHAAFAVGNACVDRTVTRYLVDRKVPSRGTHC